MKELLLLPSAKRIHEDLILTATKKLESNQSSNKTLSIVDTKRTTNIESRDILSRDSNSHERNNYNASAFPNDNQLNKFKNILHSSSEQSQKNPLKTIDTTKTVKSTLPSLTSSLDSDRYLKVYSALQSKMVHTNKNLAKKKSEECLILNRLKNREKFKSLTERNITDIMQTPRQSQLEKEQGIFTMRKDDRRNATIESEYNWTDNSSYPINMKNVQSLIKKNSGCNSEKPNFMNIFHNIPKKEHPKISETGIIGICNVAPRKILINQSLPNLPKSIELKLEKKDSDQNIQKKNNNNLCINTDGNDSEQNRRISLKETEAVSTDQIKKNDTSNTIPTVIKDQTVIATNEEHEPIKNAQTQIAVEGEDIKTNPYPTESTNKINDLFLRSKFFNAKHFLTQLSKISERSSLFCKDNDSNSFEKSSNPNIRAIKFSNTASNNNQIQIHPPIPLRKSRTNFGIEKICDCIDSNINQTNHDTCKIEDRVKLIKRALTMHCRKKRDYLNLTAQNVSYVSDNSFSKKNYTINEEAFYESSQEMSESPKRVAYKRYSNHTDFFNKRSSKNKITSNIGYNRQRPRTVCLTAVKYSLCNSESVTWNKKLPKILLNFQDAIEQPFKTIEGACSSSKLEFFDKSMNKIVLQIESEIEENKRMKNKTKNFQILKPPNLTEFYINSIRDIKKVSESVFFEYQFFHSNLLFHPHENFQLSIDKLYNALLLSIYFEINLPKKIHSEEYFSKDFECQQGKIVTLLLNFQIDQDSPFLRSFSLRKRKSLAKHLHQPYSVNIVKHKELHSWTFPIGFELGFENLEYYNRYLLLDNVNRDGSNKLSAMSTLNENEKCDIQLKPAFRYVIKHNSRENVNPEFGHRKSIESISSEGGPLSPKEDMGIIEETCHSPSLLQSPRKMSMYIIEKPSSEINNIQAAIQNRKKSIIEKFNSFKVLGKGYLRSQQTFNQSKERNNKVVSILNKDFYNRVRDEEINQGFLNMTKILEKLKLVMNKRRSNYFTTSLKTNLRDHEGQGDRDKEKKATQKMMNKESLMFRTHELKSKLLSKYSSTKDILFFYIKDDNQKKFMETIEKYKISTELKDEEGNSFLNLAVQCHSYSISLYLLNMGADVNTQNKKFNTPLHYALAYKNFILTDLLIKRGADENIKNFYGLTPWQCLYNTESIV